MPTLFGSPISPFVRKVRITLAEKKIPYDLDPVIPINVSPEYKKISPLGKIPAFRDGAHTLADSSVICAYLERKHPEPALYPSDPYEYGRALWFEEYGDSAIVQNLTATIFFQRVVGPRFLNQPTNEDVIKKALEVDLPPIFDYLEGEVKGEFIAGGKFSVGDISLASHFVNASFAGFQLDAKRWPKLAKYVAGIQERPSFRATIQEEKAMFGIS